MRINPTLNRHSTVEPAPEQRVAKRPRRPAWIPTVAALAVAALCVTAGNWQHRRMVEKQALDAQMAAASAAPPVSLPNGVDDWTAWRYRPVTLTGTFDAAHQIVLDNRVHDGHVGFDIVTPLRLDDGRVVLVDRGFTPVGSSRAVLPDAPPPPGVVTIRGRLELPVRGYFELGSGAPAGRLWQHLDVKRFAAATGVLALPIVVYAVDAPAADGLLRDWPAPDLGVEKHLSYMVQWYAFAAMVAGAWVWFTARPLLRRRARGPEP